MKANHGFLTFALGQDYQRMAYAQALTLARLNYQLTVVVDALSFRELATVANVVHLSKKGLAPFEWETLASDYSPYEVTIKTDADVVFPPNVDLRSYFSLVERLGLVSGVACNLDGVPIDCTWYRHKESELDWPNFYCAVCGFTKAAGSEFFDTTKHLFMNWWKLKSLVGDLPATTDSVFSLAYRDLYRTNLIPEGLRFIHSKQGICGVSFNDKWTKTVPNDIDDNGNLFVNGHVLDLPFHYFDKQFMSNNNLQKLKVCSTLPTMRPLAS